MRPVFIRRMNIKAAPAMSKIRPAKPPNSSVPMPVDASSVTDSAAGAETLPECAGMVDFAEAPNVTIVSMRAVGPAAGAEASAVLADGVPVDAESPMTLTALPDAVIGTSTLVRPCVPPERGLPVANSGRSRG